MSGLLLILLIILLFGGIGTFPRWRYSSGWGYGPSGIFGVILLVLVILTVMGRSPL
jgi:hypothetical protein